MSRGPNRERQVADHLRAEGWVVYRSAGSHGCADLVAMKVGHPTMLVQVKSTSGGPWEHFRPAERLALEHEAIAAGAAPWLVWWPPRKTWAWVLENGWLSRFAWPRTDAVTAAAELEAVT